MPTYNPIPYQGSKRRLADAILSFAPDKISTLYEPFAGSAAVTLAAAEDDLAANYHINDLLSPLAGLWKKIVVDPKVVADGYEQIWKAQLGNRNEFYYEVRDDFNEDQDPVKLLYLLARCVKNAVRFNRKGEFNQSCDKRRKGTKPKTMRQRICRAHRLLSGCTTVTAKDYEEVLTEATGEDLVYMDPPYLGTSRGNDPRYFDSLDLDRFVDNLRELNEEGVSYLLSFDGRTGEKEHGEDLSQMVELTRIEIEVGRSSQATLNGSSKTTYESLYLSPDIASVYRTEEEEAENRDEEGHQLSISL